MSRPNPNDPELDALERRAGRGTPRGAAAVVDAALAASADVDPTVVGPQHAAGSVTDLDRRGRRGMRVRLAAAAIIILVLGTSVVVLRSRTDPTTSTTAGMPGTDGSASAGWTMVAETLPTDQLFWSPTPVWTGREVLLPGLLMDPTDRSFSQIPAWDLANGRARMIAAPPVKLYPWFTAPVVVWTGSEMIIFGFGKAKSSGDGVAQGDFVGGAAYNPVTDSWRVTSAPPAGSGVEAAVWVDNRVVLWSPNQVVTAYDPTADAWTTLPSTGADQPKSGAELVVVGDEVFAFDRPGPRGVAYDPATGGWRRLADPPFGGPSRSSDAAPFAFVSARSPLSVVLYGGGRVATYSSATDAWTEGQRGPFAEVSRVGATVAWSGTHLIVAGGTRFDVSPGSLPPRPTTDAAAYEPTSDSWSAVPDLPSRVIGQVNPINQAVQETVGSGIWAGDRLVMFGLRDHTGGPNAPGGTLFAVAWKPAPFVRPGAEVPVRGTGRVTDDQANAVRLALMGKPMAEAVAQAEGAGWEVRVLTIDGDGHSNLDRQPDRISLKIVGGKVTEVIFV